MVLMAKKNRLVETAESTRIRFEGKSKLSFLCIVPREGTERNIWRELK